MLEILVIFCEGKVKISKRSEHNIRDFWMCSTLIQWDSFRGFRSTVYTATVQVLLEKSYKTVVGHEQRKLVLQHEWLGKNCSHSSESGFVATLAEWNLVLACDLNEVHNWWADSPGWRNITGKWLVNSSIQMNITPTWAWKKWLCVMGSVVGSVPQLTLSVVIISEGDAAVWQKQCCDGRWDHLLQSPQIPVPWSWITDYDYK